MLHRQKMEEEKKYGVKTHLIEDFKRFQISVRDRRLRNMPPYTGNCDVWINAGVMRCHIEALNGTLSVVPFPLMPQGLNGLRLPQQTLNNVNVRIVQIALHSGMNVTLTFDTEHEKNEFTTKLGDLNVVPSSNSSSSADSSPSLPSRLSRED